MISLPKCCADDYPKRMGAPFVYGALEDDETLHIQKGLDDNRSQADTKP